MASSKRETLFYDVTSAYWKFTGSLLYIIYNQIDLCN